MNNFISVKQAMELSGMSRPLLFFHYRKRRFTAQVFADVLAVDRESFIAFLLQHRAGAFKQGVRKR
jgi:hypothetical protein